MGGVTHWSEHLLREAGVTCKMNRDGQGRKVQKLEVSSEHTFWMIPKHFVATKIYDMLILNLRSSITAYNLNSDTNYSKRPFLIVILVFYQATNISLIQNKSYQQMDEKNENGINKVLRKWKIMVNVRWDIWENINTLVSTVHSLMIYTYIHRLEINFFRAKYFVVRT